MRAISTTQFIVLSVFLTISTKVLTIHPLVYEYAGKDSILSVTLGMLLDLLLLFIVIIIMQKNKDITFFELLKKCFGQVVARILLVFLFVFILLKATFLYQETHSFFMQFLYDEIPLLLYIIPLFFITGYLAVKGIHTIVRSMEIFALFILIGIVICGTSALNGINFDHILPFFENGVTPMFEGLQAQTFYRGNAIILLCFMGKIDFKKHFKTKFMLFNIVLSLLIVVVSLVFYTVYGPSARYVEFTLADLPQYDPFVSDLGRLNWLSVVVCTMALFLTSATFLYCLALIGRWFFGIRRSLPIVAPSMLISFFIGYSTQFSLAAMMEKIISEWMWINGAILIVYILICLGLLIFRRKKWEKQ